MTASVMTDKIKAYLDLCSLDSPKTNGRPSTRYTIGPFFQTGVTVLKQQIRAMNLIYALTQGKKPILPAKGKLGIIGGGIAGVTAAAAAAYLGRNVSLFEKRTVPCHLQDGCDTRHIHPHNYDWPIPGWDYPYADLPILSWKAGTAAEVTEQIVRQFKIMSGPRKNPKCKCFYRATTRLAPNNVILWDNSENEDDPCGREDFDIIILAVGFGIEHHVPDGFVSSYWRNDDLNQSLPGITSEKRQFLFISGTGDGALIDLIRSCVSGFNQASIYDQLFGNNEQKLHDALRDIAGKWEKKPYHLRKRGGTSTAASRSWLFTQYKKLLRGGILNPLMQTLRDRVRTDTTVILNGSMLTFSESLSLASASMFNSLITFLLHQLGAFAYVTGECEVTHDSNRVSVTNKYGASHNSIRKRPFDATTDHRVQYTADRLIIRHGTDVEKTLRMIGISTQTLENLKSRQNVETTFDTAKPLWPAGWWSQNSADTEKSRVEFAAPVTIALATTFILTLSDILVSQQKNSSGATKPRLPEFRITLHRILSLRDEDLYQQIAHYGVSSPDGNYGGRAPGKPERVFPLRRGLVGLACRLGTPVVFHKPDGFEDEWKELWERLEVRQEADGIPGDFVRSMLACPLFVAENEVQPSGDHVLAVLFMDSAVKDFFNKQVLEIIFNACYGFVLNLDKQLRSIVRFASRDHQSYSVPTDRSNEDINILNDFMSIIVYGEKLPTKLAKERVTFKHLRSLDAYITRDSVPITVSQGQKAHKG